MVPDGKGVTGRVTDDTQMTLFRDVIARVADDLVLQFHGPTPPYGEPAHPRERYPHN